MIVANDSREWWLSWMIVVNDCREWLSWMIVVKDCRERLSWMIVVKDCRESLSRMIVVNDWREWLSWMIVVKDCPEWLSWIIAVKDCRDNNKLSTEMWYVHTLGRQEASVTSFTINGVPLTISNLSTDLGVIVDSDLKFDRHVHGIVARANQRAALIHRCFLSRNVNNLILAFKTYVRHLLDYAPQVWSPHLSYLIDAIESVQRSFTKRLPGFANLTYAERLTNLKLDSLEQRRMHFDLIMCFNIVHGLSAIRFDDMFTFNNSCTRGHSLKLNVPVAKSDVRKFSFAVRVVPIWNFLPENIVTASTTKAFKHYLITQFWHFPEISL